jgi:hypothetical protein
MKVGSMERTGMVSACSVAINDASNFPSAASCLGYRTRRYERGVRRPRINVAVADIDRTRGKPASES